MGRRRASLAAIVAILAVAGLISFAIDREVAGISPASRADGTAVPRASGDAKATAFEKPNIIVVYTDDQRWDSLGVMPAVSRMAEEGVVFRNGFTTSPVCGPSRASLLTGRLARSQGIDRNEGAAGQFDASDTIAVRLEQQGYATALFGKYLNGYREQFPAVPPGWTEWRAMSDALSELFGPGSLYEDPLLSWNGVPTRVSGYSTDLLADYTLEFIEANADRPFFVLLSLWAPHVPFVPPERHDGALAGQAPPRPPSLGEADVSDKPAWIRDLASGTDLGPLWDATVPDYLELLLSVDEAVAAIRAKLEALDLDRDTIVVFTSDNGYLFGEHWVLGKGVPYDESIRVPLVVWNPRLDHREVSELVLNIDLAPTFAELAGAELDAADGRSFLPLLVGAETRWRHSFPIESAAGFGLPATFEAVRSNVFKYIEWEDGHAELYLLPRDRYEQRSFDFR